LWPFYASGLFSCTAFLLLLLQYLEDVFADDDGIALYIQESDEGSVGRLQTSG
jgi:hypothetical protein